MLYRGIHFQCRLNVCYDWLGIIQYMGCALRDRPEDLPHCVETCFHWRL